MTIRSLPFLISPQEFSASLEGIKNDKNLRIVDLSEQATYLSGHVPGAIFLPYQSLICGQPPAPGKLPALAQLQEIFQYLGLNEDTHFVVYDDEGGGWAGRFIWTLDIIGHRHYSYLDGGIHAWRAAQLPTESESTENTHRALTPPKLNIQHDQLVSVEELMEQLDNKNVDIWDARSAEEYRGLRGNTAKLGHMPGAKHAEWTSLMDPQSAYKIRSDARNYLEDCGIDGSKPIVTHCQTHHRSGFTYLVGKALGYDIRAYDGSWSEWGNHPNTPVEN